MKIERIFDIEALQLVEALQMQVWGMSERDIVSAPSLRWIIHLGGLILGVWDGDRLIGFNIGVVGKRNEEDILWSDMTGVLPDYQGQNIGYQLKQEQRKWAHQQGFSQIRWTFDPMQRGNAHFNFHKLGVTSTSYLPNFYGYMNDSINKGMPTDRLEALWYTTNQPRPKSPASYPEEAFALRLTEDGLIPQDVIADNLMIEIPYHYQALKQSHPDFAREWQSAVRTAFIDAFVNGYQVIDFVRQDETCWYVLQMTEEQF